MTDCVFEQAMVRWNLLREQLRAATAAGTYGDVVRLCDEILSFSAENRVIHIVDWLFDKRASKALASRGLFGAAVDRIEIAIAGCQRYRATARLAEPDDFLADIGTMRTLRDRWRKKGDREPP